MPSETFQEMQQLRFDRMRLGQAAAEIVDIPSIPEMRVALVPLTEREYDESLQFASLLEGADNQATWLRRDRTTNAWTLVFAIRKATDLSQQVFESADEMRSILEVSDINYLTDRYMEMVARSSPQLEGISAEELEDAKKVLQTIDWNELSGRSWYALKRFLSSLGPTVPVDRLRGSTSTPSSTTTKSEDESTLSA